MQGAGGVTKKFDSKSSRKYPVSKAKIVYKEKEEAKYAHNIPLFKPGVVESQKYSISRNQKGEKKNWSVSVMEMIHFTGNYLIIYDCTLKW